MKEKLKEGIRLIQKNLTSVYLWFMLVIFPVYLRDKLFDTTDAKYLFVSNVTIVFGAFYFVLHVDNFLGAVKKGWKKWDLLYVLFLLFAVISAVCSEHMRAAFTGEDGRKLGVVIYLVYGIILVLIVTAENISRVVFWGYGISTICVGGLGILNHYGIDPLGVYTEMKDEQKLIFTSTMGNIDFFSIYMAVASAFFAMLFLKETNWKKAAAEAVAMTVAGAAVACWPADTGFVAILLFFAAGWLFINRAGEWIRFLLAVGFVLSGMFLIGRLDAHSTGAKALDGLSGMATKQGWTIWIALAAFGTAAIFFFLDLQIKRKRNRKELEVYGKIGSYAKRIGIGVLGIGIGTGIYLFIQANRGIMDFSAHPFLSYLHITDEWGSLRGYVWRKTMEYWKTAPLFQKLFGVGPDTAIYVYNAILPDGAPAAMDSVYDNAHNEMLQLLLTHGLLGTLSYYGWGFYSVIESFRTGLGEKKQSRMHLAIGFTMICYFIMMLTCVNMVLVTVIPFILLSLGKREYL